MFNSSIRKATWAKGVSVCTLIASLFYSSTSLAETLVFDGTTTSILQTDPTGNRSTYKSPYSSNIYSDNVVLSVVEGQGSSRAGSLLTRSASEITSTTDEQGVAIIRLTSTKTGSDGL